MYYKKGRRTQWIAVGKPGMGYPNIEFGFKNPIITPMKIQ
jgi:hypothetical protein